MIDLATSYHQIWRLRRSPFLGNLTALAGSLAAVALATLLVARAGGPSAVGEYALLRVLPWLLAVIISCGLPYAISYFLAGPTKGDPRVRPTILAMGVTAAFLGMIIWVAAAPILTRVFFKDLSVVLVAWAAFKVASRLVVITAKAASQGSDDLAGSNLGILLEELAFLPFYTVLILRGAGGYPAIVAGLVLADVFTGAVVWARLARRGFFRNLGLPSIQLGKRIAAFGIRSQVGNLMTLLNLRLDFVLVDVLIGTAALGTYSIASKYAELVRLLPIAGNWVLYPRFASDKPETAVHRARRMLVRLGGLTALTALPLLPLAVIVIPVLYGPAFRPAVLPAQILFIGLAAEGLGAVSNAFLYGRGRPGLASIASGAGLVVTVVLDLLLIPKLGAVGAAITSSIAYLVTDALLLSFFFFMARPGRVLPGPEPLFPGLPVLAPTRLQRITDVVVAGSALAILSPLLLALWAASRLSTGASGIFKHDRVGAGSVPFVCYKFRTMPAAAGLEVTTQDDVRVTRLGRILRATSLDELPQLVNVLHGDMTLVGPRPESVNLALRYPERYRDIFAYRPGLTGITQVRMREDLPANVEDAEFYYLQSLVPWRVKLDLEYLDDPRPGRTLGVFVETVDHVLDHGRRRLGRMGPRPAPPPAAPATLTVAQLDRPGADWQ